MTPDCASKNIWLYREPNSASRVRCLQDDPQLGPFTVATPNKTSSAPSIPHLIRKRIKAVSILYAVARMVRIHRFPAWSLSDTGENRQAELMLESKSIIQRKWSICKESINVIMIAREGSIKR